MDNLDKFLRIKQTFNVWAWFWWGMVFSALAARYFPSYIRGFDPLHIFFGFILSAYVHTLYTQFFWRVIKENMFEGEFYSLNEIYLFFHQNLSETEIMKELDKAVEKKIAQKLQHDRNLNYRLL